MKIFFSQETLSVLERTHIFVDTCVLLDFACLKRTERDKFIDTLRKFKEKDGVFVTIMPVATEFYLGSTQKDLEIKEKYINQILTDILPVRLLKEEFMRELIRDYGRYAKGNISYTDLCLATAVRQFPKSFVLTRNYKDFPLNIFDCGAVFTLHLNKEVRTYCFYSYNGKGRG